MNYLDTLSSTLPILFLVGAGIVIRITCLLQEHTIQDLKKLVVLLALPLLLFKAFATMTFELRYLFIVAIFFATCTLIMFGAAKLRFLPGLSSVYSSYMMAGFEAGMLGYAVYSALYGMENISHFAVIDLGQVLFVFFILITRLEFQQHHRLSMRQTLLQFLKTPVILGILVGILANFTGLYQKMADFALTNSLLKTAELIANLTTPLVALVIGYELHLQTAGLLRPLRTVLIRMMVWVALAMTLNFLVIRQLLGLDRLFEAAVLLMAILPAPFIIPLYLQDNNPTEKAYILNTLSLGTIAALVGSVLVKMIY